MLKPLVHGISLTLSYFILYQFYLPLTYTEIMDGT